MCKKRKMKEEHGCISCRDFSSSMEKKMFLCAFIPFIETLYTDPFILMTTSVHIHSTFTNFPFLSVHPSILLPSLLFIPLFSFLVLPFLFNLSIFRYYSTSSFIPHFAEQQYFWAWTPLSPVWTVPSVDSAWPWKHKWLFNTFCMLWQQLT